MESKGRKKGVRLSPITIDFEKLQGKIDRQATPTFNPQEHNDKTRSKIALLFVRSFFFLIATVVIGIPLYNLIPRPTGAEPLILKDILLAVSGLISGPLGFVIGHYFKSDSSK